MALPTAQLGQMPNMQMPFNIPVQTYTKEPKAWEKILLGIVGNVAAAGLEKGISNVMQPDYAPQPAGLAEKFMSGPTISGQRAAELDRQFADTERADAEARNQRLNRMVEMTGQNKARTLDTERQLLATEGEMGRLQKERSDTELDSARLTNQAAHNRLQDMVTQRDSIRQGRLTDAQTKHLGAQTSKLEAEVRSQGIIDRLTLDGINRTRAEHGQPPLDSTGMEIKSAGPSAGEMPGLPRPEMNADVPTVISESVQKRMMGGGYGPHGRIRQGPQMTPGTSEEIMQRVTPTPVEQASATAVPQGMPDEVSEAASILANNRAGPYAEHYKGVIRSWLDTGQPWSEENVRLRRMISP